MEHLDKKSRKRDHSFEYCEKVVLLNIITEHYSIVESKKTDAVSVKAKNAEWHKIAEKLAAVSSIYPRDPSSLKTL